MFFADSGTFPESFPESPLVNFRESPENSADPPEELEGKWWRTLSLVEKVTAPPPEGPEKGGSKLFPLKLIFDWLMPVIRGLLRLLRLARKVPIFPISPKICSLLRGHWLNSL